MLVKSPHSVMWINEQDSIYQSFSIQGCFSNFLGYSFNMGQLSTAKIVFIGQLIVWYTFNILKWILLIGIELDYTNSALKYYPVLN